MNNKSTNLILYVLIAIAIVLPLNLSFSPKRANDYKQIHQTATPIESNQSNIAIINNSSWSWWCDPKVVRYKGEYDKLYLTWTDNNRTQWAGSYDYKTKRIDKFKLCSLYYTDDHNAPAIVPPELNTKDAEPFMIFYTGHNNDNKIRYRETTKTEDIMSLGEEKIIEISTATKITYVQACRYENVIVSFSRINSINGDWIIVISQDGGQTWEEEKMFFTGGQRSYAYIATQKIIQDSDVINIVAGDIPAGAPVGFENTTQEIHACRLYLASGDIKSMDGEYISNIYNDTDLPIRPSDMTLVYSPEENENTRLFAIQSNDLDHMEILFMGFKDLEGKSDGVYKYAVWNDGKFFIKDICPTGTAIDTNSYFAGGCIGNYGTVCLAREKNGQWFVELWKTTDMGAKWKTTDMGANWTVKRLKHTISPIKSYRPMSVINYTNENLPDRSFVWVEGIFNNYNDYDTDLVINLDDD